MASTTERSGGAAKPQFEANMATDVFAPKVASHIPRAWERIAVSAHAPRLNGKRVWKRPGDKPKPDETNFEEGMVELGKEGAGARKRLRQTGARDAIADATWDDTTSKEKDKSQVIVNPAQLSPVKSQPLGIIKGLGMVEPEHIIPRKRTNVNHLLTPKRRSRQVTLESFTNMNSTVMAKLTVETGDGQEHVQGRKPVRRSLRGSKMSIVDLSPARTQSPQLGIFETRYAPSPSPRKKSLQTSSTTAQSPRKLATHSIIELPKKSVDEDIKEDGSKRSLRRSTRPTRASSMLMEIVEANVTDQITTMETSRLDVEQSAPSLQNLDNATVVKMEGVEVYSMGTMIVADKKQEATLEQTESALDSVSANETAAAENITITGEPEVVETKTQGSVASGDAEEIVEMQVHTADLTERPSSASSDSSLSEISTPEIESITALASQQLFGEHAAQPASDNTDLGLIPTIKASERLALTSNPTTSSTKPESDEELPSSSDSQAQESISPNEVTDYHKDDTDMLLNFLTRVKADKAAKAQQSPSRTQRKRSLPHSPLRLPLGDVDTNLSPSPKKTSAPDFDAIIEPQTSSICSPTKHVKSKRENPLSTPLPEEDTATINTPIRRSGRTRLPVKKDPVNGPSLIPVRRLGQDTETTVTLKRSIDKELAALTRVNTRKNKGGALSAVEVLAKQAEVKDDPVMRQKLLKDAFNEKEKRKTGNKTKTVVWAEELVHFQSEEKKVEVKEKTEVKVGVRSKIAVGMGNGTPAPKKRRGKA